MCNQRIALETSWTDGKNKGHENQRGHSKKRLM